MPNSCGAPTCGSTVPRRLPRPANPPPDLVLRSGQAHPRPMEDPVAIRTTLAGPWGPVHIAATDRGIVAVDWMTTEVAFDAELTGRLHGQIGAARGGRVFNRRERHLAGGVKAIETFL